jgi:hypothetical protein
MAVSREHLIDWIRTEIAAEAATGFPRLSRVPDTRVVRFIDHYTALSREARSEFVGVLADWSSYHFTGGPIPDATSQKFLAATAYPDRAEGVRYTGVLMLAGLAKGPGGLTGWLDSRNVTGPARLPPETLAVGLDDLEPVKLATLRRMVRDVFAARFSPTVRDLGDDVWLFDRTIENAGMRIEVRFSGKMGRPQLRYRMEVREGSKAIVAPNLCFESVLGAGFGWWDYLTRRNAERSVALLADLVQSTALLPERMPG